MVERHKGLSITASRYFRYLSLSELFAINNLWIKPFEAIFAMSMPVKSSKIIAASYSASLW